MSDYTNSGTLGKNQYHKPGAPEYKGKGEITCPHCHREFKRDIAAWLNTNSRDGTKFFGLKFEEPYVKPEQQASGGGAPVTDDDIPFGPDFPECGV